MKALLIETYKQIVIRYKARRIVARINAQKKRRRKS